MKIFDNNNAFVDLRDHCCILDAWVGTENLVVGRKKRVKLSQYSLRPKMIVLFSNIGKIKARSPLSK